MRCIPLTALIMTLESLADFRRPGLEGVHTCYPNWC
jgi:hypothetical protein